MTEKLNFEICFFFRLAVVLSVLLRFTDSEYSFGIFLILILDMKFDEEIFIYPMYLISTEGKPMSGRTLSYNN